MRRVTTVVAAGALALAGSGLAGCGTDVGSIVVYSGQHPQLTAALAHAFEHQTGITVSVRNGDGIVLAQQISQEGTSSPADVYMTENSPELQYLQRQHLLAPLAEATLDEVPAHDRSPVGEWVGMAARVSCLVYNTQLLPTEALPTSILDLARPSWSGRLAVAPSDSDFVPLVGAMLSEHGDSTTRQWLEGLKHNATTYQDIEAVVQAVNHGDASIGIINQYYWYRLQLEVGGAGMHSRIHYLPNGDTGTTENIAGVAVLASSRHRANAERFVAFVAGTEGQQILAQGDDFEYPVNPAVPANAALPPLATIRPAEITVDQLGDDRAASQLLQQVGFH